MKKTVLKKIAIFTGKKPTPTQVFYCDYCEIVKNTYFEKHLLAAGSDFLKQQQNIVSNCFCIDSFIKSDNLLTSYEQLSY